MPALPPDADLGAVPTERLAAELTTRAAHLAAAEARFCDVLSAFDAREGWAAVGVRSCAQWLSWRCGLSPGAARERVRVSRALPALPAVRREFRAGRLSYSAVRALTRVATPGDEEQLVDWALHCPAWQLERLLRGVRLVRAQQAEDTAAAVRARRHVRWHWADDGSLVLSARLPPEDGAALVATLEGLSATMLRDDVGATQPAGATTQPADAAATRSAAPRTGGSGRAAAAAADADADADGAPGCDADSGQERAATREPQGAARHDPTLAGALRARGGWDALCADALAHLGTAGPAGPPSVRTVVEVQVAADVLDDPAADGTCGLTDGPALARSTVARLLCTAAVRPGLVTDQGDLLHAGRTRRAPTAAQRRALARRDGGCAYPGCGATRFVDAHHVHPWGHGGPTDIENLVLLCRRHHVAVHDGGCTLTMPTPGQVHVVAPDGQPVPLVPARSRGNADRLDDGRPQVPDLPPDALEPLWWGDRLDLDLALLTLPPADAAAA